MMKSMPQVKATYTVVFALRVKATSKARAFEHAMCQLGERNLHLDRLRLEDERGTLFAFKVERVESIRWTGAEATGFSHQFRLVGQIRLTISPDAARPEALPDLLAGEYRLPKSKLTGRTVWVIPSAGESAFAQVLGQSFELLLPEDRFSLTGAF